MDAKKAEELVFRIFDNSGGAFAIGLAYLGYRLGLFKAMSGAGPLSSEELAQKTELNERYVREWAKAMVASEYLDYDPATKRFIMTEEQSAVLADPDSILYAGAMFPFAMPLLLNIPKFLDIFKNGGGIPYSEFGEEVAVAIEAMFRPGYLHMLTSNWLPAVPGLVEKLNSGGTILDVGCGCGQSSVAMAKAFPKAQVIGIDYDRKSIDRARGLASSQQLDNVQFIEGPADKLPEGQEFDLACSFDCIHDMVDPIGTMKSIRAALKHDGVLVWSEPQGSENPLENRKLPGRTFAGVSPLHCMTVSLAHNGAGLGTIIGEAGARELAKEAGFQKFEKLPIQDPLNQFFAVSGK